MSAYPNPPKSPHCLHDMESRCLEAITVCIGFDDILDYTLGCNHPHFDSMIVVTSHEDYKTQKCVRKHGAFLALTDLHRKNGRHFNKGAAINAGLGHFQFHGWRLHLDADIVVPDNFRRVLFNHSSLERDCLYGADRVDIIGTEAFERYRRASLKTPQHHFGSGLSALHHGAVRPDMPSASHARYVDRIHGYCPIGFFQMWHASRQVDYPFSLGTAAHDDVLFAQQWPHHKRRLLPSAVCYHLCARPPYYGENWDGNRRQPRLKP